MRKTSPATAKRRAWKACSKYIRARDKGCCTCPAPATQAGHYQHNSDKDTVKTLGGNELWYFEKNIHGQCSSCNLYRSGNGVKYALFLENKYGKGILQEIQQLYYKPKKWSVEEILAIEQKFIDKLKQLENENFKDGI